ncbi:MAG TPA: STM3941 family protein [Ktedonobacterales bacterium]|nr:STM3941 family protein [Ktedonobacterales bacterium]
MGGSAGDGKRSAPGDSLAIYPSKIKAIIYGLLMIVFILGGLWIVFDAQADWLHEFAGIAIVVIMGYALSFIIIRALFSSAPLLMIDRQGIWLFWRPAPTGLIKWSEIDMLQVGRKSRLSPCSLYIHLVDVQP